MKENTKKVNLIPTFSGGQAVSLGGHDGQLSADLTVLQWSDFVDQVALAQNWNDLETAQQVCQAIFIYVLRFHKPCFVI